MELWNTEQCRLLVQGASLTGWGPSSESQTSCGISSRGERGDRAWLNPFIRALILFMRAPPSWLITSPKSHLLIPSPWGGGEFMEWGTHSDHSRWRDWGGGSTKGPAVLREAKLILGSGWYRVAWDHLGCSQSSEDSSSQPWFACLGFRFPVDHMKWILGGPLSYLKPKLSKGEMRGVLPGLTARGLVFLG